MPTEKQTADYKTAIANRLGPNVDAAAVELTFVQVADGKVTVTAKVTVTDPNPIPNPSPSP